MADEVPSQSAYTAMHNEEINQSAGRQPFFRKLFILVCVTLLTVCILLSATSTPSQETHEVLQPSGFLEIQSSTEPVVEKTEMGTEPLVDERIEKEELQVEEAKVEMGLPDRCPGSIYADLLDNREALQGNDGEFYPFLSSQPFEKLAPAIEYAIIWIHGFSGKADEYFCDGELYVEEMGFKSKTITIAPWFGSKAPFQGNYWSDKLTEHHTMKVWGPVRWMTGEVGLKAFWRQTLTSFEMVDTLIKMLKRKHIYPNLKRITIAGFSAGCQFASRYAFFSSSPLPKKGEADVQVVASNCGSYMYLDEHRPARSCREAQDTGPNHTCDSWEIPEGTAGFNSYKLGLEGVVYSPEALKQLQKLFPRKNIKFLLGTEDVCNCNSATYNNPELCGQIANCAPNVRPHQQCCDTFPDNTVLNVFDTKPASMLQGSNRFQRGLNYMYYLRHFYNSSSFPTFDTFFGGHNAKAFSRSSSFARWTFGL